MAGSRVRSVVSEGPKYGFPAHVGFGGCRETVAGALDDYCTRWCKREHGESDALNGWKLGIFGVVGGRVLFCSGGLDLLPPRPGLSFRYLRGGARGFHRKYVLAPADKAANNVVVWRLCCIGALVRELGGAGAYGRVSADEGLLSMPILSILLLGLR